MLEKFGEWRKRILLAPANIDLIEGILPDSTDYMLMAGRGGIGKTNLGLHAAFCLSTGTDYFGFACKKVKVGYLGFEGSEKKMLERMEKIRRNFPDPGENLWVKVGGLFKLPRQPERFRQLVKGLRVIIIDPLRYIVEHDYCRPENAMQFITCIRQLCDREGVAVIFIHHIRKRDQRATIEPGDLDNIKGAGDYADVATTVLLVERAPQPRAPGGQYAVTNPGEVIMYFAKTRDAIADIPPKRLKLNRQKLLFEEV